MINFFVIKMTQVRVKPAAFKYFHNSKTYYLIGTVLDPVIEGKSIFLLRGTPIQLVFDSATLGSINLPDSTALLFSVEPYFQEAFHNGRRFLRFTVNRINEEDQWSSLQ